MTYAGVVPVSPGCQAAASVFALTPMTSGCPASVFPSGFAVYQGLAPCGPTSGHGYAPCGRWRYSLRKASRFFQLKTIKKLPRPSALIFTSAAPHPTRKAHCSALGLVAGFRPPRPRLSGVPIRGVIEVWVSRIEPSGQGISPEPCTTHGFCVGGTGRIRTGDFLHCDADGCHTPLSHITAGHGSTPAGGLCLLSA